MSFHLIWQNFSSIQPVILLFVWPCFPTQNVKNEFAKKTRLRKKCQIDKRRRQCEKIQQNIYLKTVRQRWLRWQGRRLDLGPKGPGLNPQLAHEK